jgi:hypothetical protein
VILIICPFCGYGISLEKEEDFKEYICCYACLKIVPFGRIINTEREKLRK